ncbi:MAG: hypothetical protein U5L95_04560 [Candidatus Saccharibacteria bacterium]|nr:hypothetical protein [Candidatus Saccharibacteria bacterium]
MSYKNETQPQPSFMPELVEVVDLDSGHIAVEKPEHDLLHSDSEHGVLPTGQVSEVLIARESGPCGGVRASILGTMGVHSAHGEETPVKINSKPTNGADSNAQFAKLGIEFDIDTNTLQPGDTFMISAHGNPKQLKEAKDRDSVTVYDSTCIFVETTHREIRTAAERAWQENKKTGVIYLSIGGRPDHAEFVGTTELMESLDVPYIAIHDRDEIENLRGISDLADWERVRIVSQTTNNAEEAVKLAESTRLLLRDTYPEIDTETFPFNERDICRTVTDRQNAVREMVGLGVDCLVIVGSVNSKNTKSLVDVGIDEAKKRVAAGEDVSLSRVILVNSFGQLPRDIVGRVGIASGASTLDLNVRGVADFLNASQQPEEIGESDRDRKATDIFPPVHANRDPLQARLAQLILEQAALNRENYNVTRR